MGMSDFYGSAATRDDGRSLETIQTALEAGITFIDTADFYGTGHNEKLISQAIKGKRVGVFLSVKFGVLRTPAGGFGGIDGRPHSVKNFAAYSLNRLGVEAIDLYQPARVDPMVPIEETVGAIADLIREGKVRFLGLSETSPDILRRAHRVHPVTAVQVEYSLATRVIEKELLPTARELGISVVCYGVLSRGLLSGKLNGTFEPADFRSHAPRFDQQNFKANQKCVERLEALAKKKNCNAAQIALAWVLRQGEDLIPLIGTSHPDRLRENLLALDMELSSDEVQELSDAFPDGSFQGERYPKPQMPLVVN
jgi:aryl-alcohol dehydrogenase-like predicted oxidoreductase